MDPSRAERAHDVDGGNPDNPADATARRERLQNIVGFREGPSDKRYSDLMRSGFNGDRNILETSVDGGDSAGLLLINGLPIFLASDSM